ncbi:MAG TPA: DUF6174 domain-containing protein [Polyangiales bacterium]|nr:DUF6174 domain-containing protein [Polyangiales bacterium]
MTTRFDVLLRIAAAACLAASCAKSATQDARMTRTNPYLETLAAQQAKWRSHHLHDYTFVMDRQSMVRDVSSTRLRVIVIQGRVQSASSVLHGGSVELSLVPTIDALFERTERAAQLGPRGVPHHFEANSVGSIGLVSATDACCRDWQPDGTDGLTAEQCERAGGRIAACGARDISIGTVHASDMPCCRPLVD